MTDQPTTLDDLATAVAELLATRILCLGCTAEARKAAAAGATDDQLPPINFANVIANGSGQCWQHIQFVDRPLAPGQLPSGLLLPGQVG